MSARYENGVVITEECKAVRYETVEERITLAELIELFSDDNNHVRPLAEAVLRLESELAIAKGQLDAIGGDAFITLQNLAMRDSRITELGRENARLREYVQHKDSCGDADAYNNVETALRRCSCGLDELLKKE